MKKAVTLFLDSGAYSAWRKGVPIDLEEYILFIKRNIKLIKHYSVLDVIGNAVETLENQTKMEMAGLNPIPCYHCGSPIEYLEKYLKNYSYISLGMGPIRGPLMSICLDELFSKYICDSSGLPRVKIHGFGMTRFNLMFRYPWYSVDSLSWMMASRMGSILIPKRRQGDWVYTEKPWMISVSDRSLDSPNHYQNLGESSKKVLLLYLTEKGTDYEKVSTNYKQRDRINIIFFQDLQEHFPKWPWRIKIHKTATEGNFGL